MRENRLYGSEGGAGVLSLRSYPYPILFHTFGQDHQFAQVGEIAKRYPDATILVAHLRTMNEAGYHRIAREHPNVFVDTVGSSASRGLVERAVAAIGADKIVWGSDAYGYG